MPNSVSNVIAGTPLATGGVLLAPTGSAAPTNATTAPNVAFVGAGYIGDGGLTESANRTTDKVKAWGGDTVKVLQTDFAVTYTFTFLETLNTGVLNAVYGSGNVTKTPATVSAGTLHAVKVNGDSLPHQAFIFEVKDGAARIRIYVPNGQITTVGDVTYTDSAVIGYAVTIEAYRDSTLNANAIKYLDDGVFTP